MNRLMATLRVGLAFWNARRGRFASRAALEEWQDQRVQAHLRFVTTRSPYYRDLFEGRDFSDWQTFPISDKTAMMADFDRFNTLGIGREEALTVARQAEQTRDFRPCLRGATVGLSSGTSGNYSLFLSSSDENCAFIGTALARLLRGSLLTQHRVAFFHRAHSNLYRNLNSGRIQYDFFDLSEDLDRQFGRLENLAPTLVIGPPFVLTCLAEARRSGKLKIAPTGLLSVAEVLDDADRARIEGDFGVSVDEAYIATEGFIAATCANGSLHVNEDLLVMQREWLDRAAGRFTPIITDFRRRAQPVIRYRLDDVLVDSGSTCDCGSPFAVLDRVEGRCDDVLIFRTRGQQKTARVFPDFVRRAMYLASPSIRDYQISQEVIDRLTVRLDVEPDRHEQEQQAVAESLRKMFEQFECEMPQICFLPHVRSNTRQKRRRVVRNFKADLM